MKRFAMISVGVFVLTLVLSAVSWASPGYIVHNTHTGMVTALSTGGTAELVIPATGALGTHSIQILDGAFSIETQIPDDLGGPHLVTAVTGDVRAEGTFTITPSVVKFNPDGDGKYPYRRP